MAGHHKIHSTPHGWTETTESTSTQTFHNMLRWEHHKIDYYRWWDVGLQLQCCNKAAIFTIQVQIIPNTKKSKMEQITCEDHANFLQLCMFDELRAYSQRSAKESIILTIWLFMTSSVQETTGPSARTQFISSPTAMLPHTRALHTEVSLTTNKNL
jgi:hypothetical protein